MRESKQIIQSLHACVLLHPLPEFILGDHNAGADLQCGEALGMGQFVGSGTGEMPSAAAISGTESIRGSSP